MDDQVIFLPKKNAKSKKLYGCSKCSYQTTRAYNVHRHLTRHFKAPKELQHICPVASCSFTTLRWDNLIRHTSRVHRPKEEEAPPPVEEFLPTNEVEIEEFLQVDDDPASLISDEEFASLICEEISGESQNEEQPNTEAITKPVEPDKKTNELKRKPRKSYKSGKTVLYECKQCYYRTNRAFNIKRHVAKHSAEQGCSEELLYHVCVISGCGFSTPRWDNLCRHVRKVHPGSVPERRNEC